MVKVIMVVVRDMVSVGVMVMFRFRDRVMIRVRVAPRIDVLYP